METKIAGVEVTKVEYDRANRRVRTQFDQEQTTASMAVIATLADAIGTDPVDLDPLNASVDPDALDALVCVRNGMTGDIHVSFTHEDHSITVSSYGVVTIGPGHELNAENSERETSRI